MKPLNDYKVTVEIDDEWDSITEEQKEYIKKTIREKAEIQLIKSEVDR